MFLKEFAKGQTVFTEVEGFGATAKDYDFRIENRKTGAGVRITGDRPLPKLCSGPRADGLSGAVHRCQRRAWQGIVLADHLPVLSSRQASKENNDEPS